MNEEYRQAVAGHYAATDLWERIVEGLARAEVDHQRLSPEQLAPIDELHMGGRRATLEVIGRLDATAGQRVIDVGCGLGGTARNLAALHGCTVVGVDITPEYIEIARQLTRMVRLEGIVAFEVTEATRFPFADRSFDGALMLHVGMNIPDKAAVFAEVKRVLRPGGFFAVYDVMQTGDGPPALPVPWAAEPAMSYLERPESYRMLLQAAGFGIEGERDHVGLALDVFRATRARFAERGPPPLGPHIVMGETFREKIANALGALEAGTIAPIEMICRAR